MIKLLIQVSRRQMGISNPKNLKLNAQLASMNTNILYNRFSSKKSTKSTLTTTFHKSQTSLGEPLLQQSKQINDQNEDCSELNELKNYFLSHENDEFEESDDFLDEERGLSQVDLNEGGESDFSEEFEKAIQNSNNQQKKGNQKSLFDIKFGQIQNSSISQKSGVFCNNNGQGQIQQSQDSLEDSVEKKGLMYLRKNKNNPTFLEKKFGLNISSDPRERQSDLQRFVLKSLQLLNAKQIQHFIQIIEYFKSKLTSHNFKKSQNVHEEFFMRQVFKLFENNQAKELMDLFLKCDLIDININLFTNNVADYEKSYEIKNKHKQFDAFNKQNCPNGNTFLLNDLAEKYNNLDYLKYSTLQNNEEIEDQIDEIDIDSYDKNTGITSSSQSSQKLYVISNEISRFQKHDEQHKRQTDQQKQSFSSINQENRNNNGFKDVLLGDIDSGKEQQLFKKVAMYEYEKVGNIQKLDSKIFDQLSQNEQKNPQVLNPLCQKYDIMKVENMQTKWNTSLLEDEFFPSQSFNNESRINKQQNTLNDNFILEPTVYSQQKIIQLGRQFENQFDNNLNLIDDINSDLMLSSHSNNLPDTKNSQSNLKLQEKDFFELLNLESERAAISTKKINRIHNNKMVLMQTFERDIQQHDEVLILKQEESLIPKKFEKTTWVYMYHLPYDLNEVPNYTTYIKNFVESTFGEIEDIQFINYKDFFEIEKIRIQDDPINRNLRDSLQEQFISTNTTSTTTETEKPKKKESKVTASSKNNDKDKLNISSLTDNELLQHLYTDNKINPDFCQKALRRTEKILEKIQNKKEKKYNRSYAMIKFKDMKSKEKCLSQDIRLFGVQSFNEMFSFDDADYKKSLIISKIPWGINLQYLITKLNQQFKQNGLKQNIIFNKKDIKISMENINLKKVVTKYFLLLKLDSFKDSLEVIKAFMKYDFMIETSKLSCNHSYGSLKQGPQGFYEITDYYNKNVELLERVNERKVFEIWNIYKENTGYLNSIRPIISLNEEDESDDIEIKEDELENYNEVDHDVITQRLQSTTFTSQINNQAGFSKTSQYFQQKSISDQGYYEPQDLNEDIDVSELFGGFKSKQN